MPAKKIINEIYRSYLNAQPYFRIDDSDADRRNPDLLLPYLSTFPKEKNIVITGSKGKGSLAWLLAALLSLCGKTGLFISPHIVTFNERISVDGEMISDGDLERVAGGVLRDVGPIARDLQREEYVSPIGILALAAMRYFSERKTEWNVVECGKGAKYDDVNRIPHEYAVIGTVFLEHTKELGGTLEEIAADKACVITEDVRCVYVMEQQPLAHEVIRRRAEEMGVAVKWYGEDFAAEMVRQSVDGVRADLRIGETTFQDVKISLLGAFQAKHAALALALFFEILEKSSTERTEIKTKKQTPFQKEKLKSDSLAEEATEAEKQKSNSFDEKEPTQFPERPIWEQALSSVTIPGRMEILRKEPFCLLDSCINRQSAKEVVRVLGELGIDRMTTVLCLPEGKDVVGVAEEMGRVSEHMILTKLEHPHYPMETDWRPFLADIGIPYIFENDFEKAFRRAEGFGDPIVILTANTFVQFIKLKQIFPSHF